MHVNLYDVTCTDGCVSDLELLLWTVNDVGGRKVQGLQPFKTPL